VSAAATVVERQADRLVGHVGAHELALADDRLFARAVALAFHGAVVDFLFSVRLRGAAGERAARGDGGSEHETDKTTREHGVFLRSAREHRAFGGVAHIRPPIPTLRINWNHW
jgi:hypothetical protein